ncbi:hypothetical protein ECOK1357_2800 [Escherichia coli OK1357]|nr:hypothetical protein ECOK1357_2800 [Escherichia coli OK1357]
MIVIFIFQYLPLSYLILLKKLLMQLHAIEAHYAKMSLINSITGKL